KGLRSAVEDVKPDAAFIDELNSVLKAAPLTRRGFNVSSAAAHLGVEDTANLGKWVQPRNIGVGRQRQNGKEEEHHQERKNTRVVEHLPICVGRRLCGAHQTEEDTTKVSSTWCLKRRLSNACFTQKADDSTTSKASSQPSRTSSTMAPGGSREYALSSGVVVNKAREDPRVEDFLRRTGQAAASIRMFTDARTLLRFMLVEDGQGHGKPKRRRKIRTLKIDTSVPGLEHDLLEDMAAAAALD
ncbi:unnamed protein product, partial [Amoebophrya sp. A25]